MTEKQVDIVLTLTCDFRKLTTYLNILSNELMSPLPNYEQVEAASKEIKTHHGECVKRFNELHSSIKKEYHL